MGILLHDNGKINITGTFIVVSVLTFGIVNTMAVGWNLYSQGIPKSHTGSIVYVSHNYNRFYKYEYTNVEVLTYSGDSRHNQFWGHVDFDLGETYTIHTIKENIYFFPWEWVSNELIVEMYKIE